MKGKIITALFCFGLGGTVLIIYRAIPQLPPIAQAEPALPASSDSTIPCYPKQYRPPTLTKKSVIGNKEYIFVLAIPKYLTDSPRGAQELIFEQDIIKNSCKQHNFGVNPFSDFIPEKVAVDFKEERWKQTLQQMGVEKFKNLLNTPPELPEPFFLYGEDVQAIARLGFKPGLKAKVIKSQRDLDYLYNFGN